MLYKRWWTTHRIRCTGGVCKPLLDAVAKSYGIKRKRKGCTSSQVSVKKLNARLPDGQANEPLTTCRKTEILLLISVEGTFQMVFLLKLAANGIFG